MLTLGYAYPNLVMAENYNAPGSPYWALKTFLVLQLAEDSPFWTAVEEDLQAGPAISVQPEPHLVVCRNKETGRVAAFNSGHLSSNAHTHTSAKYEKFAYSVVIPWKRDKINTSREQAAWDCRSTMRLAEAVFMA